MVPITSNCSGYLSAAGLENRSFWKSNGSVDYCCAAPRICTYSLVGGYRQGGLMMNEVFISIRSQFLTRKQRLLEEESGGN